MTAPGQNPYPGGPNPGPGYGAPPGYGYPPPTGPHGAGPAPATGPYPGQEQTSSKALPVIVATGLAVGVFSGLLLVRGTGEAKETEGGTPPVVATADAGATATPPGGDKPAGTAGDAGTPEPGTTDAGAAQAAADAGAATPDTPDKPDQAAEDGPKIATLTFDVDPDDADVEITVGDDVVTGTSYELELGKGNRKAVKIAARARGYKTYFKRLTVKGDTTVEISMRKQRSGGSSTQSKPRPSGPGGLIDL